MVGTAVERQGIIRHGAKMIAAMSDATVPKICVVVRKAYGAGLYAMAGPGFEPDATLALPTAKIAVMGAEAAVNAVYAGKLEQLPDEERLAETDRLRREYERDIDILRLASELVVDDVVEPEDLRASDDLDAKQLTARSGLDEQRVLAILLGRWTPSPQERDAIARVFGVTRDQIAWGHKTPIQHLYGQGPA